MKLLALASISFVVPLVVGCAVAPGGQQTPDAYPVASSSPVPSVIASPATTASTAPSRRPAATASPEPSRPAEATPHSGPPRGLLASGTTEVEGWVGSYCWWDRCVDMAAVPPKSRLPMITINTDQLEFSLSDGATFTGWTISSGNYSNVEMTILDQGGVSSDPDAQPASTPPELNSVAFDVPPDGDWVVSVFVQFPGGDLSYAWHVIVN